MPFEAGRGSTTLSAGAPFVTQYFIFLEICFNEIKPNSITWASFSTLWCGPQARTCGKGACSEFETFYIHFLKKDLKYL